MQSPIRVLVVDDSSFMRGALVRQIEADPRFKVVDTAVNGRDGVAKTLRLKPDVVTLDVEMPVMNGLDALKAIVSQSTTPVVMVSAQTQAGAKTTLEALEIGAIDFIPKSRGAELIHEKLVAAVSARRGRRRVPASRPQAIRLPPLVRASASGRVNAKIVIIGSSTGGPQALHDVISQLPAGLNVPVVVAQHMPPQFTTALAQRLNDTCAPRVVEAKDGDQLAKGTVYIAPGGLHLRVTANELKVAPDQGESLYRPSVDVLAKSALSAFGKQVLGVMLTGMGNDGTAEFVNLRRAGAYNIAQDQATSVVYGMPRSLFEANGADEVLPIENIGSRIRTALGC